MPQGEEFNVASGPTIKPPATTHDPHEVIARYHLRPLLPAAIVKAIDSAREFHVQSDSLRKQFVLLSNEDALRAAAAAAEKRGYRVEIARDISDQPVTGGCRQLIKRLGEVRAQDGAPVCLISGGEFSCPVNGDGIGGRNLETALRLAMLHADTNEQSPFVAVCAGTDGIDGNSVAAGAIVDSTTIERAQLLGLNPQEFLDRSDAFSFFDALGDAIITGPTGTNVRDLRILLT